jgi:hypothetical protein
MLGNTKREIKNWQSRETGNIGYTTRRRQTKTKHNTICVRHHYIQTNTTQYVLDATICVRRHYIQTNTNNINKTWDLLQTTGGKYEPNIILCGNGNHSIFYNHNKYSTMSIMHALKWMWNGP